MNAEKNSQGHPVPKAKGVAFHSRATAWCDGIMKYSFVLLFALVPLLLTPWNYELFEYNKMMAVYGLTTVIGAAWAVKSIHSRQLSLARTPLDIPIALFVISQMVSAIFSIDPHVSWLGYYSRFNGGMWSVISYVTLYYAFLSNLDVFGIGNTAASERQSVKASNVSMRQKNITLASTTMTHLKPLTPLIRLLQASLLSGALVAIYGVAERLGVDKHLWVQDVQNRVFSTLGQPNWLAAYLVTLIPVSVAFFINGWQSVSRASNRGIRYVVSSIWGIATLLFFIVLLFTRSRSGLLGFVVADAVFWGLIFIRPPLAEDKNRKGVGFPWQPVVILHAIFALIVFINGTGTPALDRYITFAGLKDMVSNKALKAPSTPTPAGPALEVGGTESGTIRTYVWEGAVNAWRSSTKTILIGTGVETFAFAFYQHRPVGHNLTSEWDFLYNKAHNEYLNYLATTGILGLGSYLLFIGTFIVWFIRQCVKGVKGVKSVSALKASVRDSFDTFDTSDTLSFALFASWISILVTNFFGFSVVIVQLGLYLFPAFIIASVRPQVNVLIKAIPLPNWTVWLPVVGGLFVLIKIGTFWYADTQFAAGYHASRSGNMGKSIELLTRAAIINPNEPLYHDELSGNYATVAVASFEDAQATSASQLAQQALRESNFALAISPKNVNFWKTRTKVFYTLSSLDGAFNAQAIDALTHARTLSPNDPKIYYNLAILVGRSGDTLTAIQYLETAKKQKVNYRDAYYALYVFFIERKESDRARAIVNDYLTNIDPNDQQFKELLVK